MDKEASPKVSASPLLFASALNFSTKAVGAAIGGGILSFAVAASSTWYATRVARVDRQTEQGLAIQRDFFTQTGEQLSATHSVILPLRRSTDQRLSPQQRAQLYAAAASAFEAYERGDRVWQSNQLLMRNLMAHVYGADVARYVYNPADQWQDLNQCHVAVHFDNARTPCGSGSLPQQNEWLRSLSDQVARSGDFQHFRSARWPASFSANLAVVRRTLWRLRPCFTNVSDSSPQCSSDLIDAAVRRRDVLAMARENVAELIANRR